MTVFSCHEQKFMVFMFFHLNYSIDWGCQYIEEQPIRNQPWTYFGVKVITMQFPSYKRLRN